MNDSFVGATFFTAPSFEDRSVKAAVAYLDGGGAPPSSCVADLAGEGEDFLRNLKEFRDLGFSNVSRIDRFNSKALWEWAWRSVQLSSDDVVIDATCFPRELLGMLLFALSVRRSQMRRVRVLYVSAKKYITQREDLADSERWLSRGTKTIRSILGYPGDFASDRKRHVVALAGHEQDRLLEIINFLEPTRLSISNEQERSSTVIGADLESEKVKGKLRELIGHPEYGEVRFYANSILDTFDSLTDLLSTNTTDNVALVAMNTKLSFIGAALCALHLRHVRLVYSVPIEYNARYSEGAGELRQFDITDAIKTSNTIPAHSSQ